MYKEFIQFFVMIKIYIRKVIESDGLFKNLL